MITIILSIITILIILVLFFILYPIIKSWKTDNFTGSGYGFNSNIFYGKINTLIPFNLVSKATDFKLLSLMNQVKYSFVKPPSTYEITNTSQGIIPRTSNKLKNIVLFPGNTDYILKQNNNEVWPKNLQSIDNSKRAEVFNTSCGHFHTINELLKNVGYKEGDKLHTIRYDFRNILMNIHQITNEFIEYLSHSSDTVIIAYDFGAVMANICIQHVKNDENIIKHYPKLYNNISKLILICPTIGGVPMTLRDYFSGNGIVNPNIIENYDSVLLSMPNETIYNDKPVAIYNSLSYKAKKAGLSKLLKEENKPVNKYHELLKLQHVSLQSPGINCIIVASEQFNTPICYNFRNNLKDVPERYLSKNNNQFPNSDIKNGDSFEGIQDYGDKIVPISSIYKLKNVWENNNKNESNIPSNCTLEIIKDEDHFTILKSYELALIIMANL